MGILVSWQWMEGNATTELYGQAWQLAVDGRKCHHRAVWAFLSAGSGWKEMPPQSCMGRLGSWQWMEGNATIELYGHSCQLAVDGRKCHQRAVWAGLAAGSGWKEMPPKSCM